MIVNYLMRPQLETVSWEDIETLSLSCELNEIIEQGFINLSGCYISKKLFSYCEDYAPDNFEDEIAFECFVNSIHIDDYVNEMYLEHAIVFCNLLIKKWQDDHVELLNVIMSLDDETLFPTIKFHLKRNGVSWLDEDNLNSSIQGILITTDEITKNDKLNI